MDMSVVTAHIYVHHMHAWCLQRSEEGVRTPGTGVRDGCKPPCGSWELASLEEQ